MVVCAVVAQRCGTMPNTHTSPCTVKSKFVHEAINHPFRGAREAIGLSHKYKYISVCDDKMRMVDSYRGPRVEGGGFRTGPPTAPTNRACFQFPRVRSDAGSLSSDGGSRAHHTPDT
jgi:hypothetical protein